MPNTRHPACETGLARMAQRLIPRTLIEERRFEEARDEYDYLAECNEDAVERGLAQIHSLELDLMLNGDQVDAFMEQNTHEKVMQILSEISAVSMSEIQRPLTYEFLGAYPNPFNSATTISYSPPEQAQVSLKLYDISGREIETLVDKLQKVGNYSIPWNAIDFPSGVYFCRIESGKHVQTLKLSLIH